MADNTPKPRRYRRRFVAATLALLVVAFSAWWFWPRGDSRFVGKWRIEYSSPTSIGGVLWLYSNGSSYFEMKGSPVTAASPWWVSNRQLNLGHSETLGPGHPVRLFTTWLFRNTGYHIRPGIEVLDIVDVGPREVRLREVTSGEAVKLTRIDK